MKKIFKKDVHAGYDIGNGVVEIHSHITESESWFLTIRLLRIFAERLCSKNCTEEEIARYINVKLHERLNDLTSTIEKVIPFT